MRMRILLKSLTDTTKTPEISSSQKVEEVKDKSKEKDNDNILRDIFKKCNDQDANLEYKFGKDVGKKNHKIKDDVVITKSADNKISWDSTFVSSLKIINTKYFGDFYLDD